MRRLIWILLTSGLLFGCGTAGKPLPTVNQDSPTWPLTPDTLENGALPK